ncbi:putative bifunctional diguanylate cyclase/phosphodiesterase [Massilia aurea]|uniref:putative bifunctional diguanylate cyclase/phosphodiesterase n=1 Tax=Massilia aurea TaxID=373040 RepID=UPI00216160CA|nr:EAL domain-containing protein [Massilia aurea]MCS0706055.1 EAL domain-containing protein [Massilia aurea]
MPIPPDDIAQWRVKVFTTILPIVVALGFVAALPSIPLLISKGKWPVIVMDAVAMAWLLAIWRLDRVAHTVRVLNFIAMLFLVSVGLLFAVGPVGLVYMTALPALAVVLLGMRQALIGLALGAACVLLLGLAGKVHLYVPGLEQNGLASAVVVVINFCCVGALITITSGTLLKGLDRSLLEARTAAAGLEAGQLRLHAVNDELRLTSAAVARLNDMVMIARMVDVPGAEQPIIFANDALLRHTGYAREEIIGRSVRMLEGPDTDQETVRRVITAVMHKEAASAEMVLYTKHGTPYWVEAEMVPFSGDSGAITHWLIVSRDVTERRNAADAIHRLAFYDVLTSLPNRRLLMERLDVAVAGARAGGSMAAVLYVDIDNFKTVNDARGHAIGDQLLKNVADRLVAMTGDDGCVARLGGDEFVVLLDALGQHADRATDRALAVAERIRAALADKIVIDAQRYYATSSIGVALTAPGNAQHTVHDLLREADTAMYHAKSRGRNGVALFEPGMLSDAEGRLTLERDLGQALDNGELSLHLQLQVDGARMPSGAELLMRWRRKDGSSVPPDVFIPVAESSGLIVALGDWVLREACLAWHVLDRAGHRFPLSVNVSPMQFRQHDFVTRVEAILHETGVPPGQLIFEITEGLLIDRLDQTIERMHALAALGIRISIDDFGTGYSSLSYLTRMPLYELKIDKSFIRDTPHDKNGTAIVQSILAMASHLGLRVVAEGVETSAQAEYLAAHGNACMQGYLFHRPMPLEALLAELQAAPQASLSAA